MGFVKVVKNKAYFKKYQTHYRRRREGKTDYFARRKMCQQDKSKYNTPKYRLVVRRTNQYIICQIVYATIQGDRVMAAANSKELPTYGIKAGFNNFAASYATGLLVARRLLNKLGLEDSFEGVEECDGEEFHIEDEVEEDDRQPFKCILDVGLQRTTVGAKIFAAMKGAADAGLHIPHSNKRFPGYRAPEEKGAEAEFDADALRDRIFGKHVAEYMETMEEEDEAKYQVHFAKYIENDIGADDIEGMYEEAHKAIRENPAHEKAPKKDITITRKGCKIFDGKTTYPRQVRRCKKERSGRVMAKIAMAQQKMLEAAEE
jgi:large subunit ribosomal protein L5e